MRVAIVWYFEPYGTLTRSRAALLVAEVRRLREIVNHEREGHDITYILAQELADTLRAIFYAHQGIITVPPGDDVFGNAREAIERWDARAVPQETDAR